jgi:hypothetical protein
MSGRNPFDDDDHHDDDDEDDDHDDRLNFLPETICHIPQVFVFSLPPRTTSRAVSAESMKDKQIWTGALKVRTVSETKARIDLLQPQGGDLLYASAPLEKGTVWTASVEPANDSSRYFSIVLRNGDTGRSMAVGLGFKDRNEAFEFRASLIEWERKGGGAIVEEQHAEGVEAAPPQQHKDMSIPSGQKIQVSTSAMTRKKEEQTTPAAVGGGALPLPPSSSGRRRG